MCTLMLLYRRHPEFALVVAANRDERFDRPSAPPGVLRENPRVVGGKDLVCGGTWVGVNASGMVIAVTNRRSDWSDPTRRSRGLLVLDALLSIAPWEVAEFAAAEAERYNPFNLLALGPASGALVTSDGFSARAQAIAPGSLVLTTGDPNDRHVPNVARGLRALDGLTHAGEEELIARLGEACADHAQEDPAFPPFCVHRDVYGTVSSTILLLRNDGTGRYLFAPGPPCVTEYEEHSHLLAQGRGGEVPG